MTTLRVDRRSNRVDRIATTRSGRPGSSRRLDPRPAGGEYNAPWPPGRRGGRQGAGGSARPDPPAEGPAAPRADPDPSPGWEGAVAARRGGTRPPPTRRGEEGLCPPGEPVTAGAGPDPDRRCTDSASPLDQAPSSQTSSAA